MTGKPTAQTTTLFDERFLSAVWHDEYRAFAASHDAGRLEERLWNWAGREALAETQSEAAFIARSDESPAEELLARHTLHEREIEEDFYRDYRDYRDYREALYRAIAAANPDYPGTRGRLVRLTQRLLDRCLFVLFCEDMGRELAYPPQLLRDVLVDYARGRFYSPGSDELWTRLKELFAAMRDGGAFGGHAIS
jgi:hypothetical protein